MNDKQKNIIIIISAVLAVGFLTIGTLYFIQNRNMKEIVSELSVEKDMLQRDFRELMFEYDSLKPQTDTLLLMLDNEQQKVAQLMEELETVKATNAAKMREYRMELTTMRRVLKHYVFQIDSLNRVNEELVAENKKVKNQFYMIRSERNKLEREKETLTETVQRASQLEAYNFDIITVNSKGRKVRRLSKIQRFNTSFALSKNITTATGEKAIYLRITDPNEEVLKNEESGSFQYENKMIDFSSKRVIEYEGDEVELTIYYDVNNFLYAGNYRFDVFVDGNLVGQENLVIN